MTFRNKQPSWTSASEEGEIKTVLENDCWHQLTVQMGVEVLCCKK